MKATWLLAMGAVIALLAGCGGGGSTSETVSEVQESNITPVEETAPVHPPKRKREKPKPKPAPAPKPEPKKESSGVAPITEKEFYGFSTEPDRSNWEIAYGICAVTPEKQLAREFHTEENFGAIGHAYGQTYREPFNIAAEEGCMAGLIDSHAEREAAFKLMEEHEG